MSPIEAIVPILFAIFAHPSIPSDEPVVLVFAAFDFEGIVLKILYDMSDIVLFSFCDDITMSNVSSLYLKS